MMTSNTLLVTTALTYANGRPHLGHMVEAIQADIWVRFQRSCGKTCYFISGADAHGTAIMIKAKEEGIAPSLLVDQIRQAQAEDFKAFGVSFDIYGNTDDPMNQEWVYHLYEKLKTGGYIFTQDILQAYDEQEGLFLPDRYVKGDCPHCKATDQYGDNCEQCGMTYSATDLLNPRSILSQTPPIQKPSLHYFFDLASFEKTLKAWHQDGHLQAEVSNKLDEWFQAGLRPWDISRDAPYFGFKIPGTEEKYFYVWLDAPIGYLATAAQLEKQDPTFSVDELIKQDSSMGFYHFIGKDITYFHALFWPALLMGAGMRTPNAIYAHGFLTINGQKMSKSRGTFILAKDFQERVDPLYLRYYFASKLGPGLDDLDLNFAEFIQKVNTDLVGKVVNIASRCAGFIEKHFDLKLAETCPEPELFKYFVSKGNDIACAYEDRDYARAMREIMALADKANQYLADQAPWKLAKQSEELPRVGAICSLGLNLFRILMIYLQPVLPSLAEQAAIFLNQPEFKWQDSEYYLEATLIKSFQPMLARLLPEQLAGLGI